MTFQPENVELTNLLSVRALARKLVESDLSHIDAIICNAGIGGWSGMDWFKAVPDILLDIRNNTVWPRFKKGMVGSITPTQASQNEPPLGEVFCANLFGHYMLIHWLMPLLRAVRESKIIWVSSIEAQSYHFNASDFMGLRTDMPYEQTKRVTDLLVLTSNQPETSNYVESFTSTTINSTRKDYGPPIQHVYHPGIVVTAVVDIIWIARQFYPLGIALARFLGSPWSTVHPYAAAHAATWLTLTPEKDITQAEIDSHPDTGSTVAKNGRVKWGTAASPLGATRAAASEVPDWGIRGTGAPYAQTWWDGYYAEGQHAMGRKKGAVEAKPEHVQNFLGQGVEVWKQMEALRRDWEQRIEDFEKRESK